VERGRQTASKSPLHRMERGLRGEVNQRQIPPIP
jgi:hypothetical protein